MIMSKLFCTLLATFACVSSVCSSMEQKGQDQQQSMPLQDKKVQVSYLNALASTIDENPDLAKGLKVEQSVKDTLSDSSRFIYENEQAVEEAWKLYFNVKNTTFENKLDYSKKPKDLVKWNRGALLLGKNKDDILIFRTPNKDGFFIELEPQSYVAMLPTPAPDRFVTEVKFIQGNDESEYTGIEAINKAKEFKFNFSSIIECTLDFSKMLKVQGRSARHASCLLNSWQPYDISWKYVHETHVGEGENGKSINLAVSSRGDLLVTVNTVWPNISTTYAALAPTKKTAVEQKVFQDTFFCYILDAY